MPIVLLPPLSCLPVFRPLYADQTTANIELYLSDEEHAKYVTVSDNSTPTGPNASLSATRRIGHVELTLNPLSPDVGGGSSANAPSSSPAAADFEDEDSEADRLIRVVFHFGKVCWASPEISLSVTGAGTF